MTQTLAVELQSLAVFRALLKDPVIDTLKAYLQAPTVSGYGAFVSELYQTQKRTLAGYIQHLTNNDENVYIRMIGAGQEPWAELRENVRRELEILQKAADLTPDDLQGLLSWQGYLPGFGVKVLDIPGSYAQRCDNIGKLGYGIYAKYRMFYLDEKTQIVPVQNPDTVQLENLIGYQREKKIILDNTIALLEGKPAANILLTGDAGTGKSSTIKAVVNELWERGLRILEVRKEQLHAIPAILDALNTNPLKFILFIDDLSFQKDDDHFSVLKAILEGSVSAKSRNVAIYATSNRRHLVKESFADREGDDIHRSDTVQEIISLSERFGIQVTFQKPDKKAYLEIVRQLALERGVTMETGELETQAEAFALSRGGRSPRAANQFVDSLVTKA